jgi:hypothetical protein
MQALLIYILIRLDEGERDYNNYDSFLLAGVTVSSVYSCLDFSGSSLIT